MGPRSVLPLRADSSSGPWFSWFSGFWMSAHSGSWFSEFPLFSARSSSSSVRAGPWFSGSWMSARSDCWFSEFPWFSSCWFPRFSLSSAPPTSSSVRTGPCFSSRLGSWLFLLLLLLLFAAPSLPHKLRRLTRNHAARHPKPNITLAVILPHSNTKYPWAWPRIGAAIDRAVRDVNSDPRLLPDHHLTYVFKSSQDKHGICSESMAPLMAVDLKFQYNPWAFIGPGCSYAASPVGLFTGHWDVPMVTAARRRLCEHFGWSEHVMLVFSDNKVDDRPCYFAIEGLYTELQGVNVTLEELVFEENKTPINYSNILSNIQNEGRGKTQLNSAG
ncbi:hypothetical protein WMY93_033586 [Mugilogobius chulae]|uniref:Receptor ligand binding region domain-containing protein n=1 Tax=Mugilogobius chulae TaxID=88201 RepID=A0AAW0MST7_9GOBI